MKKFLVILVCLLFIITGCTNKTKTEKKETQLKNMDEKSVVIYFSATGTTKEVAKKISEVTNSDIIEIEPKEKYSDEDLDYNSNCRANKEQNDEESRPEIKNDINIDKYDTIYLGYPIWWGTNPKIILTLLDKVNFEGKNVALFCTSGSSGIETSVSSLKDYNDKINILGGKRFTTSVTNDEIIEWVNSLNK